MGFSLPQQCITRYVHENQIKGIKFSGGDIVALEMDPSAPYAIKVDTRKDSNDSSGLMFMGGLKPTILFSNQSCMDAIHAVGSSLGNTYSNVSKLVKSCVLNAPDPSAIAASFAAAAATDAMSTTPIAVGVCSFPDADGNQDESIVIDGITSDNATGSISCQVASDLYAAVGANATDIGFAAFTNYSNVGLKINYNADTSIYTVLACPHNPYTSMELGNQIIQPYAPLYDMINITDKGITLAPELRYAANAGDITYPSGDSVVLFP